MHDDGEIDGVFGPACWRVEQRSYRSLGYFHLYPKRNDRGARRQASAAGDLRGSPVCRRWWARCVAYGVDLSDQIHSAASYVDRIIKGAKPGDLPVQQPAKYTLVIDLKAAKALGLKIPPNVLALADEVIE